MKGEVLILTLAAALGARCPAATFIVAPDGSGDFTEIQPAIDAAGDGDEVLVAPGMYLSEGSLSLGEKTLLSQAGAGETILKGGVVLGDGAVIDGFTITEGDYGIICTGVSASVIGCIITENWKGGVQCQGECIEGWGGCGGDSCSPASLTLSECIISRNRGPGVTASGTELSFDRCSITDNDGDGIFCTTHTYTVCTGCHPQSTGVDCYDYYMGSLEVTGCLIVGNGGDGVSIEGTWSDNTSGLYIRAPLSRCTIVDNRGLGIRDGAPASVVNECIVWSNRGGSGYLLRAEYSCIQGGCRGTGCTGEDPLFCGWGDRDEVHVDAASSGQGDGSPENPYSHLAPALDYSYALSSQSPCMTAGPGGARIGADTGVCEDAEATSRVVYLSPGRYDIRGLDLYHHASLQGAGPEDTVVEGCVRGLRTGSFLKDLRITEGSPAGLVIRPGESPQIQNCIIAANPERGIHCSKDSSPVLTNCTIARNVIGVECEEGSSPILKACIVWANLHGPFSFDSAAPLVSYSCIEGPEPWPGEGNIHDDPLFCRWGGVTEVHVDGEHSGTGDGTEENPFSHLGHALEADYSLLGNSPCLFAGEGSTRIGAGNGSCEAQDEPRRIHLAAGMYDVSQRVLTVPVHLEGVGEETVLRGPVIGLRTGSVLSRVKVMSEAKEGIIVSAGEEPEIRDSTITGSSRGVLCEEDSKPVFKGCIISGNSDTGVLCEVGSVPDLQFSRISNNSGTGVICKPGASPFFRSCEISQNGDVGVFCDSGSAATLLSSEISKNSSTGILCMADASLVLTDCLISGNSDGGIYLDSGSTALLEGTTLALNSAELGGAVFCSDSSPTLTHCTISWNVAERGGGIYCEGNSSPKITHCILWDNFGGSIEASGGSQPSVTYSCVEGSEVWPGEGNIHANPLFCGGWENGEVTAKNQVELEDALGAFHIDVALSKGSPCIEAGLEGANMGASNRLCDQPGSAFKMIRLGEGTFQMGTLNLHLRVSIQGEDREKTVIEGLVRGLRTGASLSDVTVTGNSGEGIRIRRNEAPEIRRCAITGQVLCEANSSPVITDCVISESSGAGVYCESGAAPSLNATEISGNRGSGVYCLQDNSVTLVDCTITRNSRSGLRISEGSSATLTNCTISGNSARKGGGVCADSGSSVRLVGCTVARNGAGESGGGISGQGAVELTDCVVSDNTAEGDGGGIEGGAVLTGCTVERNEARSGGGVYCAGNSSTAVLSHCTVSRNFCRSYGSAVYGAATLTQCLIEGNASGKNGALYGAYGDELPLALTHCTISGNEGGWIGCRNQRSRVTFTSCVVWGNEEGLVSASDVQPEIRYSCIEGDDVPPGPGNTNADPQFGGWGDLKEVYVQADGPEDGDGTELRPFRDLASALSTYSLALAKGSPCIGTAENGENMGADTGICEAAGEATRRIHLGEGTYSMDGLSLVHHVSIEGAGEEVTVIEGTTGGLRTGTLVSRLAVTAGTRSGIRIGARESPYLFQCTITGNSSYLGGGIFCGEGSSPTIETCTITKNETGINGYGGGIYIAKESTATLVDCTIEGNSRTGVSINGSPRLVNCTIFRNHHRGGISINGSPQLTGCLILENSSNSGGGISIGKESTATLVDCTIARNAVGHHGGGLWSRGSVKMIRCTIDSNFAGHNGGGLEVTGSCLLRSCTISGNTAERGSGLYFSGSAVDVTLEGCTIVGNRAMNGGGVLYFHGGPELTNCVIAGNSGGVLYHFSDFGQPPMLRNCTITGNSGAVVYCNPWHVSPSTILKNCIVWNNEDDSICGIASHCLTDQDPLFEHPGRFDFSRFITVEIGGQERELPDFVVEEPDYHLQPGSPCIDAGTIEGAPPVDLEGRDRPWGAGFDIGAFEHTDCNQNGLADWFEVASGAADDCDGNGVPDACDILTNDMNRNGILDRCELSFLRGDANGDHFVDIADAIRILFFQFLGSAMNCVDAADVDDNGETSLTDVIYLLTYLYLEGSIPSQPYPGCGVDPTDDGLDCEWHGGCWDGNSK